MLAWMYLLKETIASGISELLRIRKGAIVAQERLAGRTIPGIMSPWYW
jgi:hypothetical protein